MPLRKETLLSEGIKAMIASTIAFSLMNVFVKQVSHIPAMEIVFFRCLISMIACLIGLRGKGENLLGNNPLYLFLRGASGTLALFFFFLTIQNIPLASAVTISYLSPVFTTIIAIFFLGEKIGLRSWGFFAISFLGVVVIKGFDSNFPTLYLFTGIGSALFSGIAYNLVRSLKAREHSLVIVLHFQLVGVVAGLISCFFLWEMPQGLDWLYLLIIGILTQMGQVYLTKALQAEKVARVSIINYSGIIYAIFFGWLVFGEQYNLQSLLGIALVILGVVLSVLPAKPENIGITALKSED